MFNSIGLLVQTVQSWLLWLVLKMQLALPVKSDNRFNKQHSLRADQAVKPCTLGSGPKQKF